MDLQEKVSVDCCNDAGFGADWRSSAVQGYAGRILGGLIKDDRKFLVLTQSGLKNTFKWGLLLFAEVIWAG